MTYHVDDLAVEDAGKTVTATRTYRSDRLVGDAGAGWSSAFTESLSQSAGVATLNFSDGSAVGFVTDPAAGYVPAPGVAASFTSGAGGSSVVTPDQVGYEFNPAGELNAMTLGDPGHRLVVQRSGGEVSRVTGVSGRYLAYTRGGGKLSRVADQSGRDVTLAYGGDRLTAATGVNNGIESYLYDNNDRLTKVTTPAGRVKLAASYDGQGRLAWLEQQGTGRATFGYDDTNARRTVTLVDGTVITQNYDWAGRLVTERVGTTGTHTVYDGEGRVVSVVGGVPDVPMEGYGPSAGATFYDAKGDPVLQVSPTGGFAASTFNASHKPLATTRTDATSITRTYDADGRLSTVTDPAGEVWRYTYNGRGQVTSQEDPLGRTRTVTYAGNGDAIGVSDETGAHTTFGYDPLGRRTSITDPLEHTRTTTYTPWGAPATITSARGGETAIAYDADRQQTTVTDPNNKTTTHEYDTAGRLSAVVNPLGGRTTTAYDSRGRAITVTDARGSVLHQTYTSEGWVATATDAANAVTGYGYDPAGRVYRVTDPMGQIRQTAYNRAGQPTDEWTPDGARVRYGYDAMGRRSTVTTPRGFAWTSTYDAAGRVTKTTDPLTYFTQASYDAVGRLASTTDQLGAVTSYAYNDAQRTVTITDPVGVVSVVRADAAGRTSTEQDGAGAQTSYGYDADGNATTVTDPAGSWHLEYDLPGRPTAEVDSLERRTSATYDALGRLSSRTYPDNTSETFSYDPVGNLTRHTDRTGAHWDYAFDPTNRVTTATDPLGGQVTYGYDVLGRTTAVTDQAGVVTNHAYDPLGRPAVQWDVSGASWVTTYDLDGNVKQSTDPAGVMWKSTYNNRGELTRKQWGATGTTYHDYTYDKAGRVLTTKEPYLTTYEYDSRGRQTAQINGVGDRTTVGYDAADRPLTVTPPGGHARTWTYDSAGRVRTASDGLNNTSQYAWDAAGQLTTITLPRGGQYQYTYHPSGRMATERDPLDAVTTFGYDNEGHPTSTTYPSGRAVTAGYDAAGRPTSQSGGGQTRTFGYDPAGRLTSATAPGAADLSLTYNGRGLLARSSDAAGDTTYDYDAAHRLTTRTAPSGTATTYTYDTVRGLLATVRGPMNVNLTGYDGAGQLKNRSAASPSTTGTESRTYDNAGRLATINGPAHYATLTYHPDGQIATSTAGGTTDTYTYDHAGRLISTAKTQGGTTLSSGDYTWDADGNRTSIARNGQPPVTATYDLADRLTSTSDGLTYAYDSDGLQTGDGTTGYAYNGFGELTSATTPGGTIAYLRDPLGRVAARDAGGVSQSFGYDGRTGSLAQSRTGTGPTTTLVRTPGQHLLGEATTGATTQQAWTNVHGDLVALKDDTAATVRWQQSYDPFGTPTGTTGTAPLALGYQAMYTDPATGLVNMGSRHYNPASGRFTQRDSIIGALTAPVTLNRYLYANADPIGYFDPDGRWPGFVDDIVDWAIDTWHDVVDKWNTFTGAVSDVRKRVTGAVSDVRKRVTDNARNTWHAIKDDAKKSWEQAKNLAATVSAKTDKFWDDHGATITAIVTSAVVGVVAFGACEAVAVAITAGTATPLCAAIAGAAAGAVYGGMTCPEGTDTWKCVGVGALAGAVAGGTFGLASSAGVGFFGAGAAAGFTGDAVDQVLTTGTYDPVRGAIAAATGGALGWLGGKIPGLRGESPKARTTSAKPSVPAACKHSFDPATKVLMADGSHKPIADIREGDQVLATDPGTGESTARAVVALHTNVDSDLTDLTVIADGSPTVLHTTQTHPFWSLTDKRWVNAAALQAGDQLQGPDGRTATVTDVRSFSGSETMNDLTVDDLHTYYVVAGNTPILVHNSNGCAPAMLDDISEAYVREKHMPGGANVTPDKSVFNSEVNLDDLVARGNNCTCTGPNVDGFFERNVNAGTPIGRLSEDAGGLPTSWYKIVQDKYGGVISMFPIAPPIVP